MSITLNSAAVTFARKLIEDGKIKNDAGHWDQHNPDTADENAFLKQHKMTEYASWHLGLDASKGDDTKGRYKFPFGDFKTVHRDGLIAAKDLEKKLEKLYEKRDAIVAKALPLVQRGSKALQGNLGKERLREMGDYGYTVNDTPKPPKG